MDKTLKHLFKNRNRYEKLGELKVSFSTYEEFKNYMETRLKNFSTSMNNEPCAVKLSVKNDTDTESWNEGKSTDCFDTNYYTENRLELHNIIVEIATGLFNEICTLKEPQYDVRGSLYAELFKRDEIKYGHTSFTIMIVSENSKTSYRVKRKYWVDFSYNHFNKKP